MHSSFGLWEKLKADYRNRVGYLPDMTDGEILYGWAGHFHRLSGNTSEIRSSVQLFGNAFAGFRTDIPSHLDHFAEVTNGAFGNTEILAYERSQLGFFAPFQSSWVVKKSLQRMSGDSIKTVRADLNMRTNRWGVSCPLKACPQCIDEDMKRFYITKWYLEHQWPASWVCRKHHNPLKTVKHDVMSKNSRRLILPQDIRNEDWENSPNMSPSQIRVLSKLVDFCDNLSKRRHYHLDQNILRHTYLLEAKRRRWIKANGLLKSSLWKAFQKHYPGLDGLPGFDHDEFRFENQDYVLMPMQYVIHGQHPIRNYLLMAFLFDSPDEFDIAYTQAKESFINEYAFRKPKQLSADLRRDLLRLIEQEKMPLRLAASALNIELAKARCFFQKAGVAYRKRFSLNVEQEELLQQLIVEGVERNKIMLQIGCTQSFLNKYFRKSPQLLLIWREKSFEQRILKNRTHYLELIKQNQLDSIVKLSNCPNSKFDWLGNPPIFSSGQK